MVIENRTGAGGDGIDTAIKSAPDGYSVLVTKQRGERAACLRLNVGPQGPCSCDPRVSRGFGGHPSLDVKPVEELIAAVKVRPGMGATSGTGFTSRAAGCSQDGGIKRSSVSRRRSGHQRNCRPCPGCPSGRTALMPHYKAGILRLLAQSSETRSPSLPEVPTLQEAGFKGLAIESWYGAFVPVGTPPAIVARLNAEIDMALADATTRKSLLQTATEAIGGTAEQLARVAQQDSEKYARLVKELNIKAG